MTKTLGAPSSSPEPTPAVVGPLAEQVQSPETLEAIRNMQVNFNYQAVFCLGCGVPKTNRKRSEFAAELSIKKKVPFAVSGGMVSEEHKKMRMTEADEAYKHVMSVPYFKDSFEKHEIPTQLETKARNTKANIRNIIPFLKRNNITRVLIVSDSTSHAKRAIPRLKRLYPEIIVSFYTPQDPNIDGNISTGEKANVSPEAGIGVELGAHGTNVAKGLLVPEAPVEPLPPAGKLHGSVLTRVTSIEEKTAAEDLQTIAKVPVRELRRAKMILEKPQEGNKEKALSIKQETARRIRAYTDTRDGEWYSINYAKLDALNTDEVQGWTHEMDVGLGEILRDPDITDVLIDRGGQIIKAHKGVVPAGQSTAGRLAFLDENNNYVPTFTGDKFRILSNKEAPEADYLKKHEEESATRDAHAQSIATLTEPPDDVAEKAGTEAAGVAEAEDEGGGPEPTDLTYEATPSYSRLRLGTRQLPYRFFSTTVKSSKGDTVQITNGGAPGRITPSKSGGKKREAFKDDLAKSQLRELYRKGIRVIVSLADLGGMKRNVAALKKEGLNLTIIAQGYLCSPPGKRNITLFERVGKHIKSERSIYVHCTHGTHRAPSCTAGALIAAGIAQSFAHALQLAKLDPRNFRTPDRRNMIRQIADFAKSKGLHVETPEEYAKFTSSRYNIAEYKKTMG